MLLDVFVHGEHTSSRTFERTSDAQHIDTSHIEHEHEMTVKEVGYVCS